MEDGTVRAWGSNDRGRLGDGTTTGRTTPVQVSNLSGAQAIAGGGTHSLALKTDGTVWAWGNSYSGQLGDGTSGTTTGRTTPVQVSNLSGVKAIAGGGLHSVALKTDGTVWAWGRNYGGELGDGTSGTDRTTPVQVKNLGGVKAIDAGGYHNLAKVEQPLVAQQ
jgi:alpha-tubulin suppressor-like RCC1 family protein